MIAWYGLEINLIQFGLCLMVAAALPLCGVLHALHDARVRLYHARLDIDPLAPAATRTERRHLHTACGHCSLLAEMAVTRMVG